MKPSKTHRIFTDNFSDEKEMSKEFIAGQDGFFKFVKAEQEKLFGIYRRFDEITLPIAERGEDITKNEICKTLKYVVFDEKA